MVKPLAPSFLPVGIRQRVFPGGQDISRRFYIFISHVVGICVIVHMLCVLIRTNHITNLETALLLVPDSSAVPEHSGLQNHPASVLLHKLPVAGRLIVRNQSMNDIRGHMVLLDSRPYLRGLSRMDVDCRVKRRFLLAGGRRLPGIHGSGVSVLFCLLPRPCKAMVPVKQQIPRCLRKHINKKWHDEDLRIPEDMALIAFPGQSLCSRTAGTAVPGNHTRQMILCEFHGGPLFLRCPSDLNGRHIPESVKCLSVAAVQPAPASLLRFLQDIRHLRHGLTGRLSGSFFAVFHIKQRILTDCPHLSRPKLFFKVLTDSSPFQMKGRRLTAFACAAYRHNR